MIFKYDTWNVTSVDPLVICKLHIQNEDATLVAVIATVTVSSALNWTLTWKTKQVDTTVCPIFSDLSDKIQSVVDLEKILALIDSVEVCVVNPDKKFLDLWHYH